MLIASIIAGVAILGLIIVTGFYLKRTTTYKAIISGDGKRKKASFNNRAFKVNLEKSIIFQISNFYLILGFNHIDSNESQKTHNRYERKRTESKRRQQELKNLKSILAKHHNEIHPELPLFFRFLKINTYVLTTSCENKLFSILNIFFLYSFISF